MKNRTPLLLVILVLGGASSAATAQGFAPNILVIVADDLGHADVGFSEPKTLPAPGVTRNLDRLAAEGMRLDRFYTQPFCSPTRSSFLTGNLPGDYAYRGAAIPPSTPTLPRRLKEAGYQTALIGKWHLGEVVESHPNQMGFDYYYGHLSGGIDYFTKAGANGHDWQRNGVDVFENEYSTTLLGRDAARFIKERDPSAPFFLYLSFNAPHLPPQAPAEVIQQMRLTTSCGQESTGLRCIYLAQVDVMDREIGRVMAALRSEGIDDETLVLFFSDNGGVLQVKASNAPLRKGKLTTFEGGIRVPAIARWPGEIESGASTEEVIRIQDLWRTLERAAGLERRAPRASKNMWPTLHLGRSADPHLVYATSRPPECYGCFIWELDVVHSSLIDGDWKITRMYEVNPFGDTITGTEEVALFNLRSDPTESNDLSEDEPAILRRLQRKLDRKEWRDQRWARQPLQCRERRRDRERSEIGRW